MSLVSDYINYFKHQAVNHPDLGHDDNTKKVFSIIPAEEALGSLRGDPNPDLIYMRTILYSYALSDQNTGDPQKIMQGGFQILAHHSDRSQDLQNFINVMAKCEKIVDEIVEKMVSDSKGGHPLFNYSLNNVHDVNVRELFAASESGFSGYLCMFDINNFYRVCLSHADAPAWADNGVTPHNL